MTIAVSADSRAAIEDLLSAFAHRVDNGQAATVHELFVDDGRIETPQFVLEGRAAIAERFGARARDTTRKTRHYWSNPRFSGNENTITVITNVMTAVATPDGRTILMGGSSTDVVIRHGNGWAFQSRRLDVVFEGVLAAMENKV